jgi:5'-nucleotidase / UDP-sugar diphosphatase
MNTILFRFIYILKCFFLENISFKLIVFYFYLLVLTLFCGCVHEIILPGNQDDPNGVELTLIHFNDGESHLINAGAGKEDFGGIARFATVIEHLRKNADADVTENACITLSAGDNFLAGPIFNFSLKKGVPYYDATALDIIGVDAVTLGNHDFDLGPDVLANFIGSFKFTKPVFLSANLDFSKEKPLSSLKAAGMIAKSTIIERGRKRFGIIGLTTPELRTISSPGSVIVYKDLKKIVQSEIDILTGYGINKIILVSHLQDIRNEMKLIGETRGIDIVVAGGGGELLANKDDLLISKDLGFKEDIAGGYPLYIPNADNKLVALVTTPGEYRYVGCLKARFDSNGEVCAILPQSGPVRVVGDGYPDAVLPNKQIRQEIVIPIAKALSTSSGVIAQSRVKLDGDKIQVRSRESNLGDLVADAVFWQASNYANRYNTKKPTVGMINGGSIRSSINKGKISEADIYRACPFNNFITIVEDISAKDLKKLLESTLTELRADNMAKMIPDSGRFPQLSNMYIVFNPTRSPGNRVKEIRLQSGDVIVQNYRIVKYAPSVDIATIDFLARGGDDWFFGKNKRVNIGVAVPNAIISFITSSNKNGGLNKIIFERQYPPTGFKRILIIRE